MKYEYSKIDSSLTSQRPQFLRKVYGILSLQLCATTGVCAYSKYNPKFMNFVDNIQIVSIILVIVSSILLSFGKMSKKVPTNFILLGLFTLGESFALSSMIQYVQVDILLAALSMTASITIGLTVYAMTTKKDFTILGASGVIFFSSFLLISLITLFTRSSLIHSLYLLLGSIAYGYYIVIDTQLIMGGKNGKFDIDDYILASLNLYIDIIQLFIHLLRILNKLQESDKKKNEKK